MYKQKIAWNTFIATNIYSILVILDKYISNNGLGIFSKWLIRGYSSLSFEISVINLFIDFVPFYIFSLLLLLIIKYQPNKYIKIVLLLMTVFLLLLIMVNLIITEIYICENCDHGD